MTDDRPRCEPECACQCRQSMCGCHDYRLLAVPEAPAPAKPRLRIPFLKKKDTP